MIIFESLLKPNEANFIFWGSWGSCVNWPKIEPLWADSTCPNTWYILYIDTLGLFINDFYKKNTSKWYENQNLRKIPKST